MFIEQIHDANMLPMLPAGNFRLQSCAEPGRIGRTRNTENQAALGRGRLDCAIGVRGVVSQIVDSSGDTIGGMVTTLNYLFPNS